MSTFLSATFCKIPALEIVKARALTSDEGLQLARDREKLMQEKEAEKKRRDDEQQAKEKKEQQLREAHAGTIVFRGALSSKNKTQLKDLAYSLNIGMEGTSKELIARINDHFDRNEALCDHPHYAGIFNHACTPVSVDLPTVTPLADVVNIESNAVSSPSQDP
ncbi:hypothetical protein DFH08DRAFT_975303 [Mycena albidolilacea]|uniref:Uncharacterized protein n=1 Tax=Mycena albidolilacea TaxID=1033008 RepID=A0AAD6Z5C9_9AGAR|nr:hypothetical protein DFH08DRAFT_975303 [Mycena albidolilacea]